MIYDNPFFWALVSMFGMTMAVGAWGRPDKIAKFPVVFIIVSLVTIGLCTVPLWWISFWVHILAEEKMLEDALGEKYLEYKKKVKGRMVPGLPI